MFGTRIRNFYSRRVGDVLAGGKFTGKAGKYNMNILGVKTFETTDPINDTTEPEAYFIAARVKTLSNLQLSTGIMK